MGKHTEQGTQEQPLFRVVYTARGIDETDQVLKLMHDNQIPAHPHRLPNLIARFIIPFYRIRILVRADDVEHARTCIEGWSAESRPKAEEADREFKRTLLISIPVALICVLIGIIYRRVLSTSDYFILMAVWLLSIVIISRTQKHFTGSPGEGTDDRDRNGNSG